jgi:hypothetical protein
VLAIAATCLVGAAFASAADPAPVSVLTPSTFDVIFDDVPVNSFSAPQTVTVKNWEHDKVKVGQASIVGPHPNDFLFSADTCSGQTLDAGETCQLGVKFHPSKSGTRVAHIKLPHDGDGCILWITLAGSGPAAVAASNSACDDDDDEQKPSNPSTPDQNSAASSNSGSGFLGSPAAANSAIGLPATNTLKSCKSRRSFHIRINPPRGVRFTKVSVRLNKKLISVRRGKHLSASVNLKGLPRGRFTLRVVATTASGKKLSRTRHYVTCVKNRG